MVNVVAGRIQTPEYAFTRPNDTTAYGSGDLVANSTTAADVVPMSWPVGDNDSNRSGMIRRVRMWSSDNDTTLASFRVHFYANPPSVTNGDNGALAVTLTNHDYLGYADITLDRTINNSDAFGSGVPGVGSEINFAKVSTLYALIEARAAYVPAANEVLSVVPEIHVY
jgi:hypothetical protein